MNTTPVNPAELIPLIADIAASLRTIAAWADYQHQQATGEKEYEIGSYVRSQNGGGNILYLYATHPGLKFRVATIYEERWPELPFTPAARPIYQGEQPPSKQYAAEKGFLIEVTPFRITMLPTGKVTDAGHKEYKLARILAAPAHNSADLRHPTPQLIDDIPHYNTAPPQPQTAPAADPDLADIQAANAANTMRKIDCAKLDLITRPLAPDALICALRKKAAKLERQTGVLPLLRGGKDPETGAKIPNQFGALIAFLEKHLGGSYGRKTFLADTFGVTTANSLTPAQQRALWGWINYRDNAPSAHAVEEAQRWAAIYAPHTLNS